MTKQKEPITQNIRNRREHSSRFKVMFYVIGSEKSKSSSALYNSRRQNQRHGGAVRHFRCTDTVSDKSDFHKMCLNILIQFYVWTNFHDIIIQIATPIVNICTGDVWYRNCNFFMNRGGSTFCCRPLDYHTAETGELVNGGRSPFISTVDMGARLCYVVMKQGDQLFTVDRLWLSYSVNCFLKPILLLLRSFDHYKVQLP